MVVVDFFTDGHVLLTTSFTSRQDDTRTKDVEYPYYNVYDAYTDKKVMFVNVYLPVNLRHVNLQNEKALLFNLFDHLNTGRYEAYIDKNVEFFIHTNYPMKSLSHYLLMLPLTRKVTISLYQQESDQLKTEVQQRFKKKRTLIHGRSVEEQLEALFQ